MKQYSVPSIPESPDLVRQYYRLCTLTVLDAVFPFAVVTNTPDHIIQTHSAADFDSKFPTADGVLS